MAKLSSIYQTLGNNGNIDNTSKNLVSNNNNGIVNGTSYSGVQKGTNQNTNSSGGVSTASTVSSAPTFDNNTDYSTLLKQAITSKDTAANVQTLLNQRNAKISSLGLNQYSNDDVTQQATNYIRGLNNGYDYNTDYSTLLQEALNSKKSTSEVQDLLNKRNAKVSDLGLMQYSNDSIAQQAQNYINNHTDYNQNTDYAKILIDLMNNNGSVDDINKILNQRNQKIYDSGNLDLLNDSVSQNTKDHLTYRNQMETATKNAVEQAAADEAEILAAVDEGTITLEQGKQAIEKAYQAAAKQAYLSNQLSNKQAQEQMATLGLGKTGYLPQVYGNIANSYGNALSSATSMKNQGNQDINNSIANLKASAYTDIAKMKSDNAKSLSDRVYEIQNNLKEQQNWREQFNQTNQNNQDSMDWSKQQAAYENAWQLLNQGVYSDELANTLGISADVAKRYAEVMKNSINS